MLNCIQILIADGNLTGQASHSDALSTAIGAHNSLVESAVSCAARMHKAQDVHARRQSRMSQIFRLSRFNNSVDSIHAEGMRKYTQILLHMGHGMAHWMFKAKRYAVVE